MNDDEADVGEMNDAPPVGDITDDSTAQADTDTANQEQAVDTEDMGEPLGAQVLRRMHDHAGILLEEYDQIMGVLENETVKAHLNDLLEDISQLAQDTEEIFGEEYPDLPPLEELAAGDVGAGEGTEDVAAGDTVPADSGPGSEPTGEDVVAGMETKGLPNSDSKARKKKTPKSGSEFWRVYQGAISDDFSPSQAAAMAHEATGKSYRQALREKYLPNAAAKDAWDKRDSMISVPDGKTDATGKQAVSKFGAGAPKAKPGKLGSKGMPNTGTKMCKACLDEVGSKAVPGNEEHQKKPGRDFKPSDIPLTPGNEENDKEGTDFDHSDIEDGVKAVPGYEEFQKKPGRDFADDDIPLTPGNEEDQKEGTDFDHSDIEGKSGTCQCKDPNCPACHGNCSAPANSSVVNPDDPEGTPMKMCAGCAEDALANGFAASKDMEGDMDGDEPGPQDASEIDKNVAMANPQMGETDVYAAVGDDGMKCGEVMANTETKALTLARKKFGKQIHVKHLGKCRFEPVKQFSDTSAVNQATFFFKDLEYSPNATMDQRMKSAGWHKEMADMSDKKRKDGWGMPQLKTIGEAAAYLKQLAAMDNLSAGQKELASKLAKELGLLGVKDVMDATEKEGADDFMNAKAKKKSMDVDADVLADTQRQQAQMEELAKQLAALTAALK